MWLGVVRCLLGLWLLLCLGCDRPESKSLGEDAGLVRGDAESPPRCAAPIETEIPCDAIDNDCDGVIDELEPLGQPFGPGGCEDDDTDGIPNFIDNCKAQPNDDQQDFDDDGVGDVCDPDDDGDGEPDLTDCGALDVTRYPSAPETCDAVDNDCDGLVDENIEEPCFDGVPEASELGVCRMGQQRCEMGRLTECFDQRLPSEELCDAQDNDCDGRVDEMLLPGYPDDDQDGYGDSAAAPLCPRSEDMVDNREDCNDGDPAVNPGQDDPIDDDYVDTNCDGTDGVVRDMVFVDSEGRLDMRDGSREFPFRSMSEGYAFAIETGKSVLALRHGTHVPDHDLVDGVALVGGFDRSDQWTRGQGLDTVLLFVTADVVNSTLFKAEGFEAPVIIRNLAILSGYNAPVNTTNYGLFFRELERLIIREVLVRIGDGGPGTEGDVGDVGVSGVAGAGGYGCEHPERPGQGGASDERLCGEVGGRGGYGGEPSAPVGQQGFPLNCGGAGGTQEMLDGVTGEPGSIGRVGQTGTPALTPHASSMGWVIGRGERGATGAPGGPGCGGGGGYFVSGARMIAGGGGQGGGGGCGGLGGTGGHDGGAAIGIFISGVTESQLSEVVIETGRGGRGGPGASGGIGGSGGVGGMGGVCDLSLGGTGGPGGAGGDGGRGGSGIGGRGGWTIGVACFDSNPIMGRVFVRTSAPGDSLGSAEPGEEHEFYGCNN